jgi:hypothetical protein
MTYTNLEEGLKAFSLDFEVKDAPIFTNRGGMKRIPGVKAMLAGNDYMGMVGTDYPVIQVLEKFQCFQSFASEGLIQFCDGGRYGKNGGKIFLQAKLAEDIVVNPEVGDIIQQKITFRSSYDRTLGNEVSISPMRLICTNGLTRAVDEKTYRFKNSKNSKPKFEEAELMIEAALNEYRNFNGFIDKLLNSKKYDEKEVSEFVQKVYPLNGVDKKSETKNAVKRMGLTETIHSGLGQPEIQEMTAYKLFNGVTAFVNHVEAANKKDRFEYINFSGGNQIIQRAYQILEEMVMV